MNGKRFLGLFAVVPVLVVGCAAPDGTDVQGTSAGTEQALHSATDCPAALEVEIEKPEVASDDALARVYERDFAGLSDADKAKDVKEEVDEIKDYLVVARATKTVKLKGTVTTGCAYKTVDAATGQQTSWGFWLSKSGSSLQIRANQYTDIPNGVIYFSQDLKSLSQTAIEVDTSSKARVSAEDDSTGHDGSDGFSRWIGSSAISVKIAH
jgi:hypothetical protein